MSSRLSRASVRVVCSCKSWGSASAWPRWSRRSRGRRRTWRVRALVTLSRERLLSARREVGHQPATSVVGCPGGGGLSLGSCSGRRGSPGGAAGGGASSVFVGDSVGASAAKVAPSAGAPAVVVDGPATAGYPSRGGSTLGLGWAARGCDAGDSTEAAALLGVLFGFAGIGRAGMRSHGRGRVVSFIVDLVDTRL